MVRVLCNSWFSPFCKMIQNRRYGRKHSAKIIINTCGKCRDIQTNHTIWTTTTEFYNSIDKKCILGIFVWICTYAKCTIQCLDWMRWIWIWGGIFWLDRCVYFECRAIQREKQNKRLNSCARFPIENNDIWKFLKEPRNMKRTGCHKRSISFLKKTETQIVIIIII